MQRGGTVWRGSPCRARAPSQSREALTGRASARGVLQRDVLEAVDEVGAEALHGAGELDVVEAVEHLVEHDVDLEARQVCTEAEVRAAAAERDVLVRGACDV